MDVDFPDILRKKKATILDTPQLRQLLGSDVRVSEPGEEDIILKSNRYCQIACDLRDLESLRCNLGKLVCFPECELLFLADDCFSYIEPKFSDALIRWTSSIDKG